MFFLLQKEDKPDNPTELALLEDILHKYRYDHSYETMKNADYLQDDEDGFFTWKKKLKTAEQFPEKYKKAIPIGDIHFIENFLRIFHGINRENAIEVPACLRTDEFLKRKYSIVPMWEIPRTGEWFIKDATQQKYFSKKGNVEDFIFDEMFEDSHNEFDTSIRFNVDHMYQVSEVVTVLTEYRIYVLNREINSNSFFAGNPLLFPDGDLIRKAVDTYLREEDCPRSFSLDVMITPRGTAISEVHNFTSLGLYTVDWDDNLLYAYRDGLDYVLKHNTEPTEFSNFK